MWGYRVSLRVGPKTLANPKPTGWANGGPGGRSPLAGGRGGVPQQNQKKGRIARISNPAPSGTQNAGKPKAHEGGQRGGPGGRSPLAGGLGDVPPKAKNRGRVTHPCNHATSGTQNAGKPKAHGVGKGGVQGGEAPWQGVWGMCLSDLTPWPPSLRGKGENFVGLSGKPTSGTQNAGKPKAHGGGQTGGPGGRNPHGRGFGGCAPTKPKEGASSPH